MPDGNSLFIIIMVLAIAGLFFMNSRARKRQTQAVAFRDTLGPGAQVMTSSGMFGTVSHVDGDKVTLVSSGGQESVWLLAAVAKLVEDEPTTEDVSDDAPAATADPTSRYVAGASEVSDPTIGPDGTTAPRDDTSR
jgi:preprotein translocase subunit YajC